MFRCQSRVITLLDGYVPCTVSHAAITPGKAEERSLLLEAHDKPSVPLLTLGDGATYKPYYVPWVVSQFSVIQRP